MIIDGKKIRENLIPQIKKRVSECGPVTLAILQIGDRSDSESYIKAKKKFAQTIGVEVIHKHLENNVKEEEVIRQIEILNKDKAVQGIIVQLPLPEDMDKKKVLNAIDPRKDVDALTDANVLKWKNGQGIMPATARGVDTLLKESGIKVSGKKVTVVGRSDLVGTPIAYMLRKNGALVTVCHSKTHDLVKETKDADIIVVAVGKPNLITLSHTNPSQVIIDVGINKKNDGKLCGDVDFGSVKDNVKAISQVPGGVGPMTVLGLFLNLIDLCMWNNEKV